MQYKFQELLHNIKVQLLTLSVTGLIFLKLMFSYQDSVLLTVINELIILFVAYFLVINGMALIKKNKLNPMTLVTVIGIAALFLFVLFHSGLTIFSWFGFEANQTGSQGVLVKILSFFFLLIILFTSCLIFIAIRELFFFKVKKNLNTYFNSMVVFFLLASVTSFLGEQENFKFIYMAFSSMAITLIVINSIRISWIAFLLKKQKVRLLYISIGLILVFSLNLVSQNSKEYTGIMKSFSHGIYSFVQLINIYGIIYFAFLFFTTLFHLPTAEAFDRRTKEISSLQYFSRLINQVFYFNELASTVTDMAINVCNADAAWIVLNDNATDASNAKSLAPKNISYSTADVIYKKICCDSSVDCATVKFIELNNLLNPEVNEEKFRYAAVAPLKSHGNVLGYLIIAQKTQMMFDDDDKNTLETYADYVSIAIENSRLIEESIEKERMARELDVAREMQQKLIPVKPPEFDNLEIMAAFIPAFEVGGDYYDFFPLSDDCIAFIIADVSGKGISAAFIMAEIRGIFESLSGTAFDSKTILIQANQILQRSLEKKSFVTAIYGIIETKTGILRFARAGHTSLLLMRDSGIEEFTPKGMGLGLVYNYQFSDSLEEVTLQLKQNDTLVLYTDGITEAKNGNYNDFGLPRLKEIIVQESAGDISMMGRAILKEISQFSAQMTQHDDISLVIFRWNLKTLENIHG